MKIEIAAITQQDYEEMRAAGLNAELCLAERVKLVCRDEEGHEAVSFMERERFDRLGLTYIEAHAKLYYSKFLEHWYMNCSQNDWYNDLKRNPEKIIQVRFIEIEGGTGREIYRDAEGRYYLRDVSNREPFAKWYVCGKCRMRDDGSSPRPNLIFQHGDQMEKVVYDDWNGVAAYSEQFNKNFRTQG